MMKIKPWTFKKHVILALGIALLTKTDNVFTKALSVLFSYINGQISSAQSASIAIIGGADGPTVVFLGERLYESLKPSILVFLVVMFLYIPLKR